MPGRRTKAKPPIKLPIWKKDGNLWCADPAELRRVIAESGVADSIIQKRMGYGYRHIQEIFDGKSIDGWAVAHIEYGISEEKEVTVTPANYTPK